MSSEGEKIEENEELEKKTSPKDNNDGERATTSSSNKRQYLEVNKAETMKKLLVKPCEIKPVKPSEALARVRNFLPLLKESTTRLMEESKQNPAAVDIENVEEGDEHIEMNLALMPDDSDSDSDDSDDDDDDDGEEEEEDSNDSKETTDESFQELGLGFKVKDPNRIKRLKLEKPTAQSQSSSKQPLITLISSTTDDKEEEESEKTEPNTNNT